MSNFITIQLCAEDRQRIDELIACASLIAGNLNKTPIEFTQAPLFVVEPTEEHPADAVAPHELHEPVAEPEQPKYTTADILAKVQTMAGPGNPKRERAKAIVQSYGKKVSDIPEDKLNDAMQRLIELEAEV